MGRVPVHLFTIDEVEHNVGFDRSFTDVHLIDCAPKGMRRMWTITRTPEGKYYGLLRRAPTDTADFGEGVYLPRAMVIEFLVWLAKGGGK